MIALGNNVEKFTARNVELSTLYKESCAEMIQLRLRMKALRVKQSSQMTNLQFASDETVSILSEKLRGAESRLEKQNKLYETMVYSALSFYSFCFVV